MVGAFGVIASLIYVARQVQSSQATAADTNRLNRSGGVCEMFLALSTNNELRESVVEGYGFGPYMGKMAAELNISVDDATRIDFVNTYWFWLHWGQFASTKDPKDLLELKGVLKAYVVLPAMRYSWENSYTAKPMLDSEFVKFVDTTIAEHTNE